MRVFLFLYNIYIFFPLNYNRSPSNTWFVVDVLLLALSSDMEIEV
jgi:hypothetical protein